MRPRHPERLRTFTYRGLHRYFLTFCTHQRLHHFIEAEAVALVLEQILRAADRESFSVIAYCFMPDHLHLLVEATAVDADGRRFLACAKQLSAYQFARSGRGRLWQRYGYERTLREGDGTLSVARYILENPVRAGLAARPADYMFMGCPAHSLEAVLEAIAWARPRSG
ncbi:MAG TPA: transposase [Vicinamibacterales bacterium]|nr:transposase [Vicinamibacterales bacterium]